MSDQYNQQNPIPTRPPVAAVGLDPKRPSDYRSDAPLAPVRATGGFSTGLLVAIVFVVVAIIAATVFSNRDMFGIGNSVAPMDGAAGTSDTGAGSGTATGTGTTTETTMDSIAPTPAPGTDPTPIPAEDAPAPAPADPVTPPVQSAPANP